MKELENKLAGISGGLQAAEKYLVEDLEFICDETMHNYAKEALRRVEKALGMVESLRDELKTKSTHDLAADILGRDGYYMISCLSRNDFEDKGFDTSGLTDAQMRELASDMGDDYCEQLFWDSLEGFAYSLDLPIKEDVESDDDEE